MRVEGDACLRLVYGYMCKQPSHYKLQFYLNPRINWNYLIIITMLFKKNTSSNWLLAVLVLVSDMDIYVYNVHNIYVYKSL